MLQFFTDVAQNSLSFPNSEKSLRIFFQVFQFCGHLIYVKLKKD